MKQKVQHDSAEMNTTDGDHDDHIQAGKHIQVDYFNVLNAIFNAGEDEALKYDVCDTNLVSREFVDKNWII